MDNTTLSTIFYSSLAGFSTLAGIYFVVLNDKIAEKYTQQLMSFAAGILLATAFFHLIPESVELHGEHVYLYILGGFLTFYVLESIVTVHAGPELHHINHFKGENIEVSAKMAFFGLLLHSVIDGIIIGVGFEIDPTIGVFATFSIIMHELPEGVTTYSLMMLTESKKSALIKSWGVALATPMGALISLLFIKEISEPVIGALLGIASGTFIYVAAADLIPKTHNHKGVSNIVFLMLGVVVIFFMSH